MNTETLKYSILDADGKEHTITCTKFRMIDSTAQFFSDNMLIAMFALPKRVTLIP